jgi:hypothetical protein
VSSGKHHAHVIACRLCGYWRLSQRLGNRGKFSRRKNVKTALLTLGDNKTASQFISEFGRKYEPTLLIQSGFVGAKKQNGPLPQVRTIYSTLLHFSPFSTTLAHLSPQQATLSLFCLGKSDQSYLNAAGSSFCNSDHAALLRNQPPEELVELAKPQPDIWIITVVVVFALANTSAS